MMTKRTLLKASALFGFGTALPALALAGDLKSASASGFKMPLESDPHERTFMQWPNQLSIYEDEDFLHDVQDRIAKIANAIAKFEPVVLLVGAEHEDDAKASISPDVETWAIETQDLWCRDSGPAFVTNGKGGIAISELNFNGWGEKQDVRDDRQIARRVAAKLGLDVFDSGAFGEGGGVETDGAGTLMAHESCWVNPNRNQGTRDEIEKMLLESLGAEKMIWAPGVKGADITDYHIDALARFVRPGQVLIQLPAKIIANDPWSKSAYETYEILKKATDANGNKMDIVVINEPDATKIRSQEPDFVSSYVNYFVCNGGVISAEFGDDKADEAAAKILSQLYPGREVVSLDVDPIGEAGGGIHCSMQQQPKIV